MNRRGDLAPIVETHAHLDEPAFDADRADVLHSARAVGVRHFVNIGYNPERWESSLALRDENPDVEVVLGLHPRDASRFDRALERALRRAIGEAHPVAVGETGLDFAHSAPARGEQHQAFQAQLAIAAEFGLPVVIHQREAGAALTAELDLWPGLAPIVLHSFDGDERLTHWAIERGCYFGIGGLACKASKGPLRELLAMAPMDRLLLETDAPYLTPPGVQERRNTPANLPRVAELLAPLWKLSAGDLCRVTTRNAHAAFGFDGDDETQD